ncbi:unnamed protein product [Schistocephalus solidus]|uniref:Uncharacterized protein n=1 Tax=Schistocephalus solidus TaxID=70667 RepID=A0A183THX8_SCHSO|nr:unnamed protein product [Schistocephalus solidus]
MHAATDPRGRPTNPLQTRGGLLPIIRNLDTAPGKTPAGRRTSGLTAATEVLPSGSPTWYRPLISQSGTPVTPTPTQLGTRTKASPEGIQVSLEKLEDVRTWLTPKPATEIRGFLRLASDYHWSILHFTEIDHPLQILTDKGCQFI